MACVCSERSTVEKAIKEADAVVTGKILSKTPLSSKDGKLSDFLRHDFKYKVEVTTKHKGKLSSNIVTIISNDDGCGYVFKIGKLYTIYAYRHPVYEGKNLVNSFLRTNICMRTERFNQEEYNRIVKYCKTKGYR